MLLPSLPKAKSCPSRRPRGHTLGSVPISLPPPIHTTNHMETPATTSSNPTHCQRAAHGMSTTSSAILQRRYQAIAQATSWHTSLSPAGRWETSSGNLAYTYRSYHASTRDGQTFWRYRRHLCHDTVGSRHYRHETPEHAWHAH